MKDDTVLTLAQWRKLRELSQEELAQKAGVTARTIISYESDVRNLENAQYKTVKKIADTLDIKVSNIFLDSTSEIPKIII